MSNLNEYLVIKNYTLKNYLSNERFKDCNFIKIIMIQPSYNNLSYYDKIPIFERFKDPNLKNAHFKTIFRNNIESLKYDDIHSLSSSLIRYITCNNIGQKYTSLKDLKNNLQERNNDIAYIIDYKKTFEKYINKYKRIPIRIKKYFQDKEVSLENIENIDKELNLILYEYKKFISIKKRNKKSSNKNQNINDRRIYNFKDKKKLLIGSVENYNWEIMEPFFESLKSVEFENCDCIIFVNNILPETIEKIKSFGVIVFPIPKKYLNTTIINYRWKLYHDFLNDSWGKYNLVFTADIRDTIFQKDIFKYYENQQSFLGVGIEDKTLFNSSFNRKWLINAYGEELIKSIKNERIICVGTIWGTPDKFSEFSKIMWEKLSSNWSKRVKVIEQAVANFMIYHDKMFKDCLIKSENKNGQVMTIGNAIRETIKLDSNNNILNGNGDIASVIHQYDRKSDISIILKKKYCSKTI